MSATFADAASLLLSTLLLVAAIHVYRNYKAWQSDGKTRWVIEPVHYLGQFSLFFFRKVKRI